MKMLPPPKAAIVLLILSFFSSPYLLAGPKPILWREKDNSEKSAADIEENGRRLSSREDTDEDSSDPGVNTSANMSRGSGMAAIAERPQKEKAVDSAEMPPQLFTPEELDMRVLRMQEHILKWQQVRGRVIGSHVQEQTDLLNQAKIELEAYKRLQEAYASFIGATYFADPEVREKIPALMSSFEQVLAELQITKMHLNSTELGDNCSETVQSSEEVSRIMNDFLKLKEKRAASSSVDMSHLPREAFSFSRIQEGIHKAVRSVQNSRLNSGSFNENSFQNLEPIRATQVQRSVIAVPYLPPVEAIEMNEAVEQQRQSFVGRTLKAVRSINWGEVIARGLQNSSRPFKIN